MVKEKTGAVVGGVFLSIGVNIAAGIGLVLVLLATTVFNIDYYKNMITNDKTIKVIYNLMEDEANGVDGFMRNLELTDLNPEATEDLEFSDLINEDFIQMLISDAFDVVIEQDEDAIHEDYYIDYFMDEMIPTIEEKADIKLSKSERKEAAKQAYAGLKESLFDSMLEDNDMDLSGLNELFVAKNTLLVSGIVCFIVAGIMAIIEILIYKNKFRALRNISIAVFVMGIFDLITVLVSKVSIVAIFNEALAQIDEEQEAIVELVVSAVSSTFNTPLYVCLGITLASLVGIIMFAILAKGYKSVSDEDDYVERKAAPAPAPVVPAYEPADVINEVKAEEPLEHDYSKYAPKTTEEETTVITEAEPAVSEEKSNKVCPSCGYVGSDDEKFCQNCGTKLQ